MTEHDLVKKLEELKLDDEMLKQISGGMLKKSPACAANSPVPTSADGSAPLMLTVNGVPLTEYLKEHPEFREELEKRYGTFGI